MVNNSKTKINTISFSSQIFNERIVCEIGSTATVGSILTWIQESGKETSGNFFPALRYIYKSKHGMATQGSSKKCNHYDMLDGKMGYALTQNALWNRKHTGFLLCKCKRGEAFRNADHVYKLITH